MGGKILNILFAILSILVLINADPLYDDNDKVVLLNSTNFKDTIVGTKNAWIVQFFNSWCGHCIAFAPIWKSFAQDVYNWRNIITVAALDCSITSNEALCREYEVHAFPTIKFFKPNTGAKDLGIRYQGRKSEETIRQSMIDFLSTFPEISNRLAFSNFKPKQNSGSISIWENIPPHVKVLIVVAEDNNSYVGKEVIFDVMDYPDVKVIRVLSDNIPLLKSLNIKKTPAVVLLTRSVQHYNESGIDRGMLIKSVSSILSVTSGFESNQDDLGGGDEGLGAGDIPQEISSQVNIKSTVRDDNVYMVDLENSIRYSLMQEVPLHKQLKGENLQALRDFVELLTKYFPGRLDVRKFLQRVLDWLNFHSEILMEDYLHFIANIQTTDSLLPPMRPWIGCRGSQPNLRGYPCSLWVLFHTLTVEHYNRRNKDQSFDPQLVLKIMTGYIKNFFSCSECSQHFQEMAALFPKEVTKQADGVLWLWRAHNKVNARLKGSPSEDQQHPKLQFPQKELCPSCHSFTDNGNEWNVPEVQAFMISHYSRPNIINVSQTTDNNDSNSSLDSPLQQETNITPHQENTEEQSLSRPLNRNQRSIHMHGNFEKFSDPIVNENQKRPVSSWGFNSLDMSLCVMLYMFSTGILLTVYFVVIVKRRLKKKLPFYSSKYSV